MQHDRLSQQPWPSSYILQVHNLTAVSDELRNNHTIGYTKYTESVGLL